MELTHINIQGRAKMVNVEEKAITIRRAIGYSEVVMKKSTLDRISQGLIVKGDVLSVAQVAGIIACKNTSSIIPMCHPLMITGCDINFKLDFESSKVCITSTVSTEGKTGVEMEALTAVSVAALTIYDMCKAIDKEISINNTILLKKTGGKSGTYERS
ncbi:cyclic pyranopterin monophosphate synthase MoaC [Clostridium tunisiense]|uniref:cyclic pyranopterin monophosphate synthase MoaC n=1 Tax=Clostridium tunisiense TaxID=219748 RepID=UPI0002D7F64B|nr:cyclic pyranopterin monophosphate synthase MoaC [Clostridium tunisiense]